MAKEDKGKVKMTVIHFETESDNATLQANIHSIAQTLARALAPPPPRVVHTPAQITSGNGAGGDAVVEQAAEVVDHEDAIDADATPVTSTAKKTRRPRVTPAKVLNDIDFEFGDMPFKTFWEQKNPTSQSKRYLVVAAWLKEHRAIDEITGDHIYTCYRWLGLNTPKDITQPLRDMKTQGWFDSGSTRGTYAINRIGMNEVNNMDKTE